MDTASTVNRVGATQSTTVSDRDIVATMDPFLPPIEQLQELCMKLAYDCTRQQCGTVLTPLHVPSARLPPACGLFSTKVVVLWRQRGMTLAGDRFDGEVLGLYHVHAGQLTRAQMFYCDTAAVASFLAKAKGQATAPPP